MIRRVMCVAVIGVLVAACTPNAFAKGPVIKEWSKMEKNDKGEMKEVWYMTIDGVMVHETDPAKVTPPVIITPPPAGRTCGYSGARPRCQSRRPAAPF